jgi:general secretion pathway protein G
LVVTRVRGRFSRRHAFTLVEILVVVAIIGILAGIVLGVSGYASKKSDRGRAMADMERMRLALEEYRVEKGHYMSANTNDVTQIVVGPHTFSNLLIRYDDGIRFTDPWGRPYRYQAGSKFSYKLWSQGPSATTGSDDIDTHKGEF